jgi:hypothetical protein
MYAHYIIYGRCFKKYTLCTRYYETPFLIFKIYYTKGTQISTNYFSSLSFFLPKKYQTPNHIYIYLSYLYFTHSVQINRLN